MTGSETVVSGTIKIGSGAEIDAAGKTLNRIISEIISQGNVTALIKDGKFTIESETSGVSIQATEDMARVTGLANYSVQSGTATNTSAQNVYVSQGAAAGLTGSETVVSGTIKVGSGAEINTAGKTLNQIINEIDLQGNVMASITDGKFTIESETSGVSIQSTGDMARVTGLANYSVQSGTVTNTGGSSATEGFDTSNRLTEEEALAQGYTIINNASDLQLLNGSTGKFILMSDIDLSGKNWTPITTFKGTLDGNYYSIKNLTMTNGGFSSNYGLFAQLDNATIKNLAVTDVNINTTSDIGAYTVYIGALAVEATEATISNCYSHQLGGEVD